MTKLEIEREAEWRAWQAKTLDAWAAEVEQWRSRTETAEAENERLRECWDTEQQAHLETHAENKRLRAVLDEIKTHAAREHGYGRLEHLWYVDKYRAALGHHKDKSV